jgi:hypothetical protein
MHAWNCSNDVEAFEQPWKNFIFDIVLVHLKISTKMALDRNKQNNTNQRQHPSWTPTISHQGNREFTAWPQLSRDGRVLVRPEIKPGTPRLWSQRVNHYTITSRRCKQNLSCHLTFTFDSYSRHSANQLFSIATLLTHRPKHALQHWQLADKTSVCDVHGAIGSPAYHSSLSPQVHKGFYPLIEGATHFTDPGRMTANSGRQ